MVTELVSGLVNVHVGQMYFKINTPIAICMVYDLGVLQC